MTDLQSSKLNKQQLDKLREVPILLLLGIHNKGRRVSMRCPFHDDRTPSFSVYPNNSYHCFACGANGQNAIDFLLELGEPFPDVIAELQKYV